MTKMANDRDIEKDVKVIEQFVRSYCQAKHKATLAEGDAVCPECRELLDYAAQRRRKCPYDPKPSCRKCKTHCYREPYRSPMREVMRFGAMRMLRRGRVDKLVGLALTRLTKR